MNIQPVNRTFNKGLAIIVEGGCRLLPAHADGVSLHTGYCLGNRVEFLGKAKILPEDKQIYLIGHGNSGKGTINKKTMKYIAKKLLKAGYDENKILYITACEAKALPKKVCKLTKKESIYDLLYKKLKNNGITSPNIQSDFDGISIIAQDGQKNIIARNVYIDEEYYKKKKKEQDSFLKDSKLKYKTCLTPEEFEKVNSFKLNLIKEFGG